MAAYPSIIIGEDLGGLAFPAASAAFKNGVFPLGRPNRPRYLVELTFLDIGPIDWRPSQSP
jgi:hypothetical protein